MRRIALLGLGAEGGAMATNWLKKGFPLTIWNRTRAKSEGYSARGTRVAYAPREAAQHADVVAAMVADDAASREVWLGADGALSNMRPGAISIEGGLRLSFAKFALAGCDTAQRPPPLTPPPPPSTWP
jgi:3-hydroxyisobutyrate dehydrogenase